MPSFSEIAKDKMLDLYSNHDNEVGSELKKSNPEKYKDFKSTDCITYVLNVLSHAFRESGDEDSAKHVWKLGERGVDLAKYLVNTHGWKGVYINSDSVHPADGSSEHTYSSYLTAKTCKYYQIPMTFKAENYAPTANSNPFFKTLNKHKGKTTLTEISLLGLDKVSFGFGLSRGGQHTWLYSKGKVYEVHWNDIGADLYEATNLKSYAWLSGAIIIPSDQAAFLSASSKLKCAG